MKWLVGLAIASGTPARADDRAVVAEVPAGAPFDAAELTAAIRLRVPPGGPAIRVRVIAMPGGVRVEAHGNARDVALRGSTGPAAARLVALAASDLLLDDLAAAPDREAPAATSRPAVTLAALGGVAAWHYTLASLGVDVSVARDSWLLAIEAGGGTLVDGPLHLTAGVIRLGCGTRFGALELRAGATLVPLAVANGSGDATVLAGGGASARLRAPLGGSAVRGVIGAGIDLFATRTTYVIEGMPVMTTPRSALWLGAGVEVTP